MSALIITVFLTSLLGSLHCAGMCGPFVAFCVGTERQNAKLHAAVQTAYHGGRLAGYVVLGLLAGLLGSVVDLGGEAFGLRRTAMILAGVAMAMFGLVALLHIAGVRSRRIGVPKPMQRIFRRGIDFAQSRHPVIRALLIGLLAILLPCGWLYAFVIVAAGTASPWIGAATMAVFWLGTVPILAALGVGLQTLLGPVRRHVPTAMALLLVAMGAFVAVRGFEMRAMAESPVKVVNADHSTEGAVRQVKSINPDELPCCADPTKPVANDQDAQ
jgi:sulfite exporter TauE/SafE